MAKLPISTNQKTTVIDPVNANLETAFLEGVEATGSVAVLEGMPSYVKINDYGKTVTKDTFRQVIAAFIKIMGFDRPGIGTGDAPIVVPLAKVTGGGTDGSLTIVGGLIVARVNPT